jgi:hypothetical protein
MTHHARQRAAERGMLTRQAKRAVQHPVYDRPAPNGCRVAVGADGARVVYTMRDGLPYIVTVTWQDGR